MNDSKLEPLELELKEQKSNGIREKTKKLKRIGCYSHFKKVTYYKYNSDWTFSCFCFIMFSGKDDIMEKNMKYFCEKINQEFEAFKVNMIKEIEKLDVLINEELILASTEEEQMKIINKIWKSQTKTTTIKLNFQDIKEELRIFNLSEEEIEKKAKQRERSFNGMTAREWVLNSRNVWNDVSSPRKSYHKEHGAVFPLKLSDRLISMYSKEGDTILDPFSGIGTTLNSAYSSNRNSVGFELSNRFFQLTKDIFFDEEEFPQINHSSILVDNSNEFKIQKNKENLFDRDTGVELNLYNADCRLMEKYISPNTIQALITSPPYADFIHHSIKDREKVHKTSLLKHKNNSTVSPYSESDKDLGNLPYNDFLKELETIMKSSYNLIKPGGYSIWVVKDYKNKEKFNSYLDFHTDISKIGEKAGFLYHDLIVWDQNEQRSLVLLGYPSRFHTNQNCSFIVVLRKPDTKELKIIEKKEKTNVKQ